MKYEVLYHSVLRLPFNKGTMMFEEYSKNTEFATFAEQQRLLDILTIKCETRKRVKQEVIEEVFVVLALMAKGKSYFIIPMLHKILEYPLFIWSEAIGELEPDMIISILRNYNRELKPIIKEMLILNLPEEKQVQAIKSFASSLDKENESFQSFYYALTPAGKKELKKGYAKYLDDDTLLELEDLSASELDEKFKKDRDRIANVDADGLLELVLLKASDTKLVNTYIELYQSKINELSIYKFKFLISRYKFLSKKSSPYYSDDELFHFFKVKFHEIGIKETLTIFNHRAYWNVNDLAVEIISDLMDVAYADEDIKEFINRETITEIVKRHIANCHSKEYTIADLEALINNIGKREKIIHDDYISAIIACGKLMASRTINDHHPLFLQLREKFTKNLLGRVKRDGTYTEDISLNGIFYRLIKGSLDFDSLYNIETYKGLIYLSKSGIFNGNADHVVQFLTDAQIAKMNISPVLKWRNSLERENTKADSEDFKERLGLQLMCFFGIDRAKYLLESKMQGNLMENLFDRLNYESISIRDDGTPEVNVALGDFLFGKGRMEEPNTVINKMIRGEIPEFKNHFADFCANFDSVKEACHGVLTVTRIVKYFSDIPLPIELQPDEEEFRGALLEMATIRKDDLQKAVMLCKGMRSRNFSTIPKIKGSLGDFTYEMLDLHDPLTVAVGKLSHCCFVVNGESDSALRHAMLSLNGRVFVVYYKGVFTAQSWVWRNGDVVCFDSIEAGSPLHGMKKDEFNIEAVYKKAASEIMCISASREDEIQKVKVVTVGKSDYVLEHIPKLKGKVPRPLETDVYVYDSDTQWLLAGAMPENPRYEVVGARYLDPREKVITIDNVANADLDLLDKLAIRINSLRYQLYSIEDQIDYNLYIKFILGDGWYMLFKRDGTIEKGVIPGDEDRDAEYASYLRVYDCHEECYDEPLVRVKPSMNKKEVK